MQKSIYTPQYEAFVAKLVTLRKAAGLTQRQLARKLRRTPSVVARIETGERRADIVEFYWICRACGIPPEKASAEMMRAIGAVQKTPSRSRGSSQSSDR